MKNEKGSNDKRVKWDLILYKTLAYCRVVVHVLREQVFLCSRLPGSAGTGCKGTSRVPGGGNAAGRHAYSSRGRGKTVGVEVIRFRDYTAFVITVQQPLHRYDMRSEK